MANTAVEPSHAIYTGRGHSKEPNEKPARHGAFSVWSERYLDRNTDPQLRPNEPTESKSSKTIPGVTRAGKPVGTPASNATQHPVEKPAVPGHGTNTTDPANKLELAPRLGETQYADTSDAIDVDLQEFQNALASSKSISFNMVETSTPKTKRIGPKQPIAQKPQSPTESARESVSAEDKSEERRLLKEIATLLSGMAHSPPAVAEEKAKSPPVPDRGSRPTSRKRKHVSPHGNISQRRKQTTSLTMPKPKIHGSDQHRDADMSKDPLEAMLNIYCHIASPNLRRKSGRKGAVILSPPQRKDNAFR
ncbi:hypothetical protein BZG36_01085 [Bifiguratus adelaidae]|uniref:Uncharacterized protein n=1 Tax=Bifiguratus adelaidae TaxID=1938954 RepID=A0A261Y610_9FUNG|nr:hypothetical protein BZG36_01085 [Bifiguratus adelaidae]